MNPRNGMCSVSPFHRFTVSPFLRFTVSPTLCFTDAPFLRFSDAPTHRRTDAPKGNHLISSYRDLDVYQMAMEAAIRIFELTKAFPSEERYSLVDQIRRASRSVCANVAEGWRKRRYSAAFVSKLSDSEAEAAETQVWAEFALRCGYWDQPIFDDIDKRYDHIIGKLVRIIDNPDPWLIKAKKSR